MISTILTQLPWAAFLIMPAVQTLYVNTVLYLIPLLQGANVSQDLLMMFLPKPVESIHLEIIAYKLDSMELNLSATNVMMDSFSQMISPLVSLNVQHQTVPLVSMLIMITVKSVIKDFTPMILGCVILVLLPIVKLALKDCVSSVKLVINLFQMVLHVFLTFVKDKWYLMVFHVLVLLVLIIPMSHV